MVQLFLKQMLTLIKKQNIIKKMNILKQTATVVLALVLGYNIVLAGTSFTVRSAMDFPVKMTDGGTGLTLQ